jgi:hypothetical protein
VQPRAWTLRARRASVRSRPGLGQARYTLSASAGIQHRTHTHGPVSRTRASSRRACLIFCSAAQRRPPRACDGRADLERALEREPARVVRDGRGRGAERADEAREVRAVVGGGRGGHGGARSCDVRGPLEVSAYD